MLKIHLLDSTSATENLEALGPLIKTINESRQQELFLRTINDLIQSKDDEIQKICGDNYQASLEFRKQILRLVYMY